MDAHMVGDNSKKSTPEVVEDKDNNLFGASVRSAAEETDQLVEGAYTIEKPTRCFYFVKCPINDDPQLNTKLDRAQEESRKWSELSFQIGNEHHIKWNEFRMIAKQIKLLESKDEKLRKILKSKSEEQKSQQKTQGKVPRESTVNYEKDGRLCSSKQELNDLICSSRHRMQHRSTHLVSEKKFLREIQEIVVERDNVIANERMAAESDYVGNRFKEFYNNFSRAKSVEARNEVVDKEVTNLRIALDATKERIISLRKVIRPMRSSINEVYQTTRKLRIQRDREEAYQSVMKMSRELAANKDVTALEELSKTEVEKFMRQWNTSCLFRDDYEKRIVPFRV